MEKLHNSVRLLLMPVVFMAVLFSCKTVPANPGMAYYLPADGDRVLSLDGKDADRFLRPMADSMGMEDYEKIKPILEETDRFYLVTRGEALFIQGQGNYNTGFISFVLGSNRDWKKEKIGPFKTYRSESTSMQLAFPDDRTFLISQGYISDLLDSYYGGGSMEYPFSAEKEKSESLLIRVSLEDGEGLPMQDILKIPFKSAELALSAGDGELFLMDVALKGEKDSGRIMGTALKLFLLTSVGREVMKAPMETGNDYASISDVSVDFDFLLNMIGI